MVIGGQKWTILTKTGADIDIILTLSFWKVELGRANNQCDE
jgi:hypothetical protein